MSVLPELSLAEVAEITADATAMLAERTGDSLRDGDDAVPPAVNWGSDYDTGWIDLEGGLRLAFTVRLTETP